jgi:hypothetical protein
MSTGQGLPTLCDLTGAGTPGRDVAGGVVMAGAQTQAVTLPFSDRESTVTSAPIAWANLTARQPGTPRPMTATFGQHVISSD